MTRSPPGSSLQSAPGGFPPDETPAGCLGDDAIAALADGTMDPAARASLLSHLADCARCRSAVAAVARALGDDAVARAVAEAEPPRRRRWPLMVATAAAAAIVLVLMRPEPIDPVRDTHRAPALTNGTAPGPVAPIGVVGAASRLQWATVTGADLYRVTVFDTTGHVLFELQLSDTVAVLPDSVGLQERVRYLWKVEARTGFDRWVSSALVEFSIAERGGR